MTMLLGIITDAHADLGALRAALDRLDALGVDLIVCAGDLVDGGDQPEEVIALLREREIPCIRGNHARWALMRHDRGEPEHEGDAHKLFLKPTTVAWLAALPTRWDATIEGVRVAVRHGTPKSDMDGIYPDATGSELTRWCEQAEADVLIVGHTHIPVKLHVAGGKLVVNPGALWRGAETFETAMLLDPAGGPARTAEGAQGGCFGVLECPRCAGRSTGWTTSGDRESRSTTIPPGTE